MFWSEIGSGFGDPNPNRGVLPHQEYPGEVPLPSPPQPPGRNHIVS